MVDVHGDKTAHRQPTGEQSHRAQTKTTEEPTTREHQHNSKSMDAEPEETGKSGSVVVIAEMLCLQANKITIV